MDGSWPRCPSSATNLVIMSLKKTQELTKMVRDFKVATLETTSAVRSVLLRVGTNVGLCPSFNVSEKIYP